MATETVVSDHSPPCEGVEKEEVKKIEAEIASQPPKETSCAETEGKIEEEQIEARVEHVKDSNTDEEAKTVVAAAAVDEKIEDKAVCVEVPPAGDESIIEKEAAPQEKVDDNRPDKKVEDVPTVEAEAEPAEKQGEDKCGESSEVKLEEPEKEVVVAETLPAEVIEKKGETAEETPLEVVEPTEAKEETAQPADKCEAIELVQKETPEAQPVEAKTPSDKAQETKLPEEVETTTPCETSELVKSEALVSQVEQKNVQSHPTDEGNELTEEKAAEADKIEEKTQVPEEKSVVAEELVQPSQGEPAEKAAKDEATSKDIKLEETTKDVEKTEEAKLVEETIKGTVEASEAKVEEEKPAKVEVQNQESIKDCEDAKKTEDLPKESVPVKTQKPSIVKIVKQSLVKAKKAIIGKSQSTKTAAPELKDDGSK